MLMNKSGSIEIVDLWYDWINGRNFNIIQKQLGKVTYDLEWNNGTSFYYTLDASKTCRTVHFEVSVFLTIDFYQQDYLESDVDYNVRGI